jgi:glycosyltransferase involved in cell wall biosynthesis
MNILFISHSAGKTGAPYLLLSLVRWFCQNTSHGIQVLLKNDGPLRADFARFAETMSMEDFMLGPGGHEERLRAFYAKTDLIYSNTGTNGRIMAALAPLRCPVVTHMHEMRYALAMWGDDAFHEVVAATTLWICASTPVRDNLRDHHGVDQGATVIIPDFIHIPDQPVNHSDFRPAFLTQLGLTDPVRIVLGAGTFDWRKGADLFIQAAAHCLGRDLETNTDENIHFVWIGDEGYDQVMQLRTSIEIQGLGIERHLHLLGFRDDLQACIGQCDLFLLTSREDPCPLVALEAAAQGKPVVCFQKAGGIADLAASGAGMAVPFMDTHAMAAQCRDILDHPDLAQTHGSRGAQLVRRDYGLEGNARAINQLLERIATTGSGPPSTPSPAPRRARATFIPKSVAWARRLRDRLLRG